MTRGTEALLERLRAEEEKYGGEEEDAAMPEAAEEPRKERAGQRRGGLAGCVRQHGRIVGVGQAFTCGWGCAKTLACPQETRVLVFRRCSGNEDAVAYLTESVHAFDVVHNDPFPELCSGKIERLQTLLDQHADAPSFTRDCIVRKLGLWYLLRAIDTVQRISPDVDQRVANALTRIHLSTFFTAYLRLKAGAAADTATGALLCNDPIAACEAAQKRGDKRLCTILAQGRDLMSGPLLKSSMASQIALWSSDGTLGIFDQEQVPVWLTLGEAGDTETDWVAHLARTLWTSPQEHNVQDIFDEWDVDHKQVSNDPALLVLFRLLFRSEDRSTDPLLGALLQHATDASFVLECAVASSRLFPQASLPESALALVYRDFVAQLESQGMGDCAASILHKRGIPSRYLLNVLAPLHYTAPRALELSLELQGCLGLETSASPTDRAWTSTMPRKADKALLGAEATTLLHAAHGLWLRYTTADVNAAGKEAVALFKGGCTSDALETLTHRVVPHLFLCNQELLRKVLASFKRILDAEQATSGLMQLVTSYLDTSSNATVRRNAGQHLEHLMSSSATATPLQSRVDVLATKAMLEAMARS